MNQVMTGRGRPPKAANVFLPTSSRFALAIMFYHLGTSMLAHPLVDSIEI